MTGPEQQARALQRVVHKIALPDDIVNDAESTKVELPEDAEIIHFGFQRATFCIWYVTQRVPSGRLKRVRFVLRGTGHPLPLETVDLYQHVGSCFTDQVGTYVFHLFRLDEV